MLIYVQIESVDKLPSHSLDYERLNVRNLSTGEEKHIFLPFTDAMKFRAKLRRLFGFEQMAGTSVLVEIGGEGVESIDPVRSFADVVRMHVEWDEARELRAEPTPLGSDA